MLRRIRKFITSYSFYQNSQYWDQDKIGAYQDEKLRNLICHAGRNVSYYRNLFKQINFDYENFRGRADLKRIPLLDKETIRTRQKELIADNAGQFGIVWESTSGSTGTPLHIIVDQDTQMNKLAALLRSYQWAGYSLRMRTFSLQSYYINNADYEFKPIINVLRFDSNKLKKESAIEVAEEVNRRKPKFFMGFPFDLLLFSRFAEEAGIKIDSPKSMVTYGETLSNEKRTALESAYSCEVFDYYCHHEAVVMIAECEHHQRHLVDDFAYHELVDENGEDAWGAGKGELVGTGYYNYAMPLIRYRTRDDIELGDQSESCVCGRAFPIIDKIHGKQCDYIETPDGRFLGAVMSHSIDRGKGVVMSQCIQDAIDHIDVNLVVDSSYNQGSQSALEEDLRKRLGQEMKINFYIVSQLEKRSGGKTPFILSKIGHQYS
jgi:phenylacetate-CoA ligase